MEGVTLLTAGTPDSHSVALGGPFLKWRVINGSSNTQYPMPDNHELVVYDEQWIRGQFAHFLDEALVENPVQE